MGMIAKEAIQIIDRILDPDPWEDYGLSADKAKEALQMAIDALEKQIPRKPVIGYAFPSKLREVMKRTDPEKAETKTDCCPVCGRTLGVSEFVQTQSGLRVGDPHCKRCGQAINWGDEGWVC